MHEKLNTIT